MSIPAIAATFPDVGASNRANFPQGRESAKSFAGDIARPFSPRKIFKKRER